MCRIARWLAVSVVAASPLAPARAQDRPLLTEPATLAGGGSLTLEVGLDAIADEPNFVTGSPRDRWAVPVIRLTFSPADTVELDLEWAALVGAFGDPDFGEPVDFGDVTLRTKVRALAERPGRPALAGRFSVTLPETIVDQGLGPNTLRASVELLATQAIGRSTLHGNLGLTVEDRPLQPAVQSDFLVYGLAATHAVRPSLALLAEIHGRAGNGDSGADQHAEARAGLRWARGRWTWDAALRRGLADADGTWGFTVGLRWHARVPATPGEPQPAGEAEAALCLHSPVVSSISYSSM